MSEANIELFPMMEGKPCVVRVNTIDVMATVYRDAAGMLFVERPVMLKYEVTSQTMLDENGEEFTREISGYRPIKWVPLSDAAIIAVLPAAVTLIAELSATYRKSYLEWVEKLYAAPEATPSSAPETSEETAPEALASDQDKTALQTYIFESFEPTGVIH